MRLLPGALCGDRDGNPALTEYVRANSVKVTGAFRSIYLESSPNRGENSGDCITQISVPVASMLGAGDM